MSAQSWIEPPPQKKGGGCFGKGCLILLGLLLLFALAFMSGTYYAMRHYFLASHPVTLPQIAPSEEEAAGEVSVGQPPPERAQVATQKLNEFKKAARNDQAAHVEYSARDINALIQRNRKSRDTAVVAIEGNTMRVETSIPLSHFDSWWQRALGLSDKYLNCHFTIASPENGDLSNLQINDLVLNNHKIPGDALNFTVVGRTPRSYVQKYAQKYSVSRLEIEDGKVILEAGGQ